MKIDIKSLEHQKLKDKQERNERFLEKQNKQNSNKKENTNENN